MPKKSAANLPAAGPANLAEIVALAQAQVECERLIEDLTQALKDHSETLRRISQEDLPAAMAEAQLMEFTLATGEKITIKQDYSVGIPEPRRDEAFNHLESEGFGAMVKTIVAVEFGKGGLEPARKLFGILAKKNLPVILKRDVHWQTLKAWVAESARQEPPRPVPAELFGVVSLNKAVVKLPKK